MRDPVDDLTTAARELEALEAAASSARQRLYATIRAAHAAGVRKTHIARATGVSRVTIDRILVVPDANNDRTYQDDSRAHS